jgi:L-aminopeptidase/D-esterase-like protein
MRRTPNITDVEGILVGHYTLRKRPTGCTVITARRLLSSDGFDPRHQRQ